MLIGRSDRKANSSIGKVNSQIGTVGWSYTSHSTMGMAVLRSTESRSPTEKSILEHPREQDHHRKRHQKRKVTMYLDQQSRPKGDLVMQTRSRFSDEHGEMKWGNWIDQAAETDCLL